MQDKYVYVLFEDNFGQSFVAGVTLTYERAIMWSMPQGQWYGTFKIDDFQSLREKRWGE